MLHIMLNKKSKRHYYVEKILFFFLLQTHDFIHVCSIRKKFKCALRAQNTQYLKVKENPQALFLRLFQYASARIFPGLFVFKFHFRTDKNLNIEFKSTYLQLLFQTLHLVLLRILNSILKSSLFPQREVPQQKFERPRKTSPPISELDSKIPCSGE